MDHNDKRNSSVPLGTFEPTAESEGVVGTADTAEPSDTPFEGREDTWPNFTVGVDRPRRRTRTLMGVPGLMGARDSQPEDELFLPDGPSAGQNISQNISQAIAEELNLAGPAAEQPNAAEPLPVEPLEVSAIDPDFDPEFDSDAQEVTSVYDSDLVVLSDSTPPAVPVTAEADGGETQRPSLIEVAPPPTLGEEASAAEPLAEDALAEEAAFDVRKTLPEIPSELAGDIPLLTDHMRPPKQERSPEPITVTEVAPPFAADGGTNAAPVSMPPANLSSLAPREVTRKRPQPVAARDTSSRNGALLVAAVMLLATGGWYLTSGTFRRASLSEAPTPAPTTAAVAQPTMPTPGEPSAKPSEAAAPQAQGMDSSNAVASNSPSGQRAQNAPPSAAEPALPGPSPKNKVTLTTTSRNPRFKPAPRAKPALVPPPGQPGTDTPEQPSRNQVIERLEAVRSSVRACAAGRSGVADLDITIAHTGSVMHVLVGGDFAGTTEGSCIARAVRTARFPTFKQERFRLLFPYAI